MARTRTIVLLGAAIAVLDALTKHVHDAATREEADVLARARASAADLLAPYEREKHASVRLEVVYTPGAPAETIGGVVVTPATAGHYSCVLSATTANLVQVPESEQTLAFMRQLEEAPSGGDPAPAQG